MLFSTKCVGKTLVIACVFNAGGGVFLVDFEILVSQRGLVAGMANNRPFGSLIRRRTVWLIVDPKMEIDALNVVVGLPDFSGDICGVVLTYGRRAFHITLKSAEAAAKLAAIGFPYGDEIRPLVSKHVSVFVSMEYPDEDLIHILKTYGACSPKISSN